MLPNKIAFVDVETTGMRPTRDRVIEIGIVQVENNSIVNTFHSLVNPGVFLPPEIKQLTGITQKEIEKAPTFREIFYDIQEMLKNSVFVAHNVRFDLAFLKNEFRRLEKYFSPKHFCTVKLSRLLYPQSNHHNLDSIIERFQLACPQRHRAYDDAKILYDFFIRIQQEISNDLLEEAINKAMKRPSVPLSIAPTVLDSLPQTPGVYIFYGKNNMPLYIGKSINIKDRVLSHFSEDYKTATDMKISQQIDRIETIETCGELGALLKESALIKKLQPLYNKKLRNSRRVVVIQKNTSVTGYLEARIQEIIEPTIEDMQQTLGVFRSKKSATDFLQQKAEEYNLCKKLLHLEKSTSSCFGYRLEKCKGACKNTENAMFYNVRFIEAFSPYSIKTWPFSGPIVIEEEHPEKEKREAFLIDKWCFLGEMVNSTDQESSEKYRFDVDTYKIIARFLSVPQNIQKVKTLSSKYLYNNSSLY